MVVVFMSKISCIEISTLKVPVKIHLIWGRVKFTNHLLIRLYMDEQLVGVGEGTPYLTDICNSYVLCKKIANKIIKRDFFEAQEMLPKIQNKLSQKTLFDYAPFLALETAVIDAISKSNEVPFSQILGGSFRDGIPVSGTVFLDSPQNMARVAKNWTSKGVKHLKVKVTCKSEVDSVNLKYIRDAVPNDVLIRIDANQGYGTVERATAALRKLEKYNIAIVEQPIKWNDLSGLRKLRKLVDCKIMLDESLRKPSDVGLIAEKGAADIINFHPSKLGCLTVTRQAIQRTMDLGLKYMIGSAVMTGIGVAEHLHLAASLKRLDYPNEEIGLYEMFGKDVIMNPLKIVKGCIKVPKKYGIGVNIDEKRLRKYSINLGSPKILFNRVALWAYLKSPSFVKNLVLKAKRSI